MLELSRKKGGSQYKMRRNRGIKKIVIFVLLSVLAFGNTISYQQFVQKNRQLEVRVQSQKNRMDLMLERQIKE